MNLEGQIHVRQGLNCTYGEILRLMKPYLPELSVSYLPRERERHRLEGQAAAAVGWAPKHDYHYEIETLCDTTAE